MKEKRERNYKMLNEFVLVKDEKTPIFREINVKVKPIAIGKNGPEYEILDKDDNRIGKVNDNKIFIFDGEYKELLKKRMGKMYDYLGFDKEKLKIDIKQKLQEQEERKQQQNLKENDKNESKENKQIPKKDEQDTKNDKQKNDSISKEELKNYNNVRVTDFEFVADMINPNEYNIYDTYFVNKNGKFQMMAWNMEEQKYDKVQELISKENKIGKLDTIEKNRPETEIGRGTEVTYLNRFGERVEVNFKQLDSGEIEGRVSFKNREGDLENKDKGDLDGDGDVEGIKISTALDNKNAKIKSFDHSNNDMNAAKKENYIETDEINEGKLEPEQIKAIIQEKIEENVISEDDEVKVLQKIALYDNDEITKENLEEIIEEVSNDKQNEIEKSKEENEDDEWVPWKPRSH